MKHLPDYQSLPPVGEPDDLFDTKCSRCDRWFVEEEVIDGVCVNCLDELRLSRHTTDQSNTLETDNPQEERTNEQPKHNPN